MGYSIKIAVAMLSSILMVVPCSAQEPSTSFNTIRGKWINLDGPEVFEIDGFGRVSAVQGALHGRLSVGSFQGGADYAINSESGTCFYSVNFYDHADKAVWRLTGSLASSANTPACPAGHFAREWLAPPESVQEKATEDAGPSASGKQFNIVYWRKKGDKGNVEKVLADNDVQIEVRESGSYGGYDFSDDVTDELTCSIDVPPPMIRHVALMLFDGGVRLKSISVWDRENSAIRSRLNIESVNSQIDETSAESSPYLTRKQILALEVCPKATDRTYGARRWRFDRNAKLWVVK